jgi:hypothetical protein
MRRQKLNMALIKECEKYLSLSFKELVKMHSPLTYECNKGDDWYQVEVQILEKNDNHVRVLISIDDGRFLRTMFPISKGFVRYKNEELKQ